ncbi:ornithine carbamoyltransferase [Erythrobacteraceae bacterium CFH 75059]|uniref:ornithine carbamoyltransferase n=1 Tax=Qipengyuania thermophila TaxID=2509361 RepID=UPI00101F6B17|nr:ornithine carbamoyltransferase [Qipengyuania thermophila]TCD06833.1 ornithine carbamoyltransferase [Erythrobacteraceae bacterium CFH 75059]
MRDLTAPAKRGRDVLSLGDLGTAGLREVLTAAAARKRARGDRPRGAPDDDAPLRDHVLGMVFEKSSTRTRVSFDMAMRQLGGAALVLDAATTQLGRGESVADTARVLGRMVDMIMVRTDDHAKLETFARSAAVPVINGLTDLSHPCQIVADLMTLAEHGKALERMTLAWLGDGNNVLHSLLEAAGLLGFGVRVATPANRQPDPRYLALARAGGADVRLTLDPREAVEGVDAVFTDTWVSMGQVDDPSSRAAFEPYRVTSALMRLARPDALFLHCLPAHVGDEVAEDVFEGPQSVVFAEAENRLHAQKAILLWCAGNRLAADEPQAAAVP